MSEKELITALRAFMEKQSTPAPDAAIVAQEIVRRDAWRLRILAGLSLLFWIAGLVGIFIVFYSLRNYLIVASSGIEATVRDAQAASVIFTWERQVNHSLEIAMGCLGAWMLGSLCTMWLISSSRRATLSQINFNLLRLSEQLTELRRASLERTS